MPGLVTHMYLADRIIDALSLPEEKSAYILAGSIAPDAAYAKPDFQWEHKQRSHLRSGYDRIFHLPEEQKRFQEEISCFIEILKEKEGELRLFYLGYLIHLITDAEFILKLWWSLRTEIQEELQMEDRERTPKPQYFHEAYAGLDSFLLKQFPRFNQWLTRLEGVKYFAVEDYLTEQDIRVSRCWVINKLKEMDRSGTVRFLEKEEVLDYVDQTVKKLVPLIRELYS